MAKSTKIFKVLPGLSLKRQNLNLKSKIFGGYTLKVMKENQLLGGSLGNKEIPSKGQNKYMTVEIARISRLL